MRVSKRDERGHAVGNFRKMTAGGLISPWVQTNGYLVVSRMVDGVTTKRYVHRLVAATFTHRYFDGATVDHIDGDRRNNRADNLQWVSRAENTRLQNLAGRGVGKGENHPSAKLNDSDVPALFKMREDGLPCAKIGAHFGVSGSLVHKITSGIRRSSK